MVEEYKGKIVTPGEVEIKEPGMIISYKRFRGLHFSPSDLLLGILVKDVPVRALLTIRKALEEEKARGVADNFQDGRCKTLIKAHFGFFPEGDKDFGLVVSDGNHAVGYAAVNNIERVDVVLQPQVLQSPKGAIVRPIWELVKPHKDFLRKQPEADVCIIDIYPLEDGGFALRFNGKKPFRTSVVSLETDKGKVNRVSFVGQDGNVISARVAGDSVNKLSLEIINKLLINPKG